MHDKHRATDAVAGRALCVWEWNDWLTVLAWGASVLLAFGFHVLIMPVIGNVRYQFEGKELHTAHTLPLLVKSEGSNITMDFQMDVLAIFPKTYFLKPDDCLKEVSVNGQIVKSSELGACFHNPAKKVPLGSLLHSGRNDIRVVIEDHGGFGGLIMAPSRTDPLYLSSILALVLSLGFFLRSVFRFVPLLRPYTRLGLVCYGGTVLRMLYVFTTPYILRGHDTDAHIDYIRYVVDHLSIPPAITGWEYYQPPLYYFFMAFWVKLNGILGWTFDELMFSVQQWSLLFSTASFGIGLWIFAMLFRHPEDEGKVLMAGGILAVYPGLIYTAARISNDPLMQFLSYLFLAILIRWWRRGRLQDWYVLTVIMGLALLTKNNAYLFLPIAYGCMFLKRKVPWKAKIRLSALSCLILVGMVGWYIVVRALETNHSASIIGNVAGTHSGLLLQNQPLNFIAFHPIRNLQIPFNSPWEDAAGRQFFWDYFFRSSLFGEFNFGQTLRPLTSLIVLFAEGMLLCLFWGLLQDMYKRLYTMIPLSLTISLLLGAQLGLRAVISFSPLQDFRYATVLTVPMSYYIVRGIDGLPFSLRKYGLACLGVFVLLSGVFLTVLFFQGV
ncbi:hypothetical protein A3H22_00215 [Candidatus Peribacteria bacterium RIFCSPLOWO2_12_FULL_55_15]|nr:MAG: hypothetical protein A2789_01240 [Candidatus Peribacteria bacterium RIFCSPHIGHO2_01_FULL_54_22]OGJ70181.1 MAG: hypothetical protein A3H90_00555 [Candidatus Peribacteria bacterium RIFCSPLOWO2_02_FULL_55_36]OGJ71683.1 MAG: hypothetical protein A3H22_00215 [Candidatus Peribacteria bacterium RIFCSPLOWO2_12_FULL_55_15]